MKKCMLLFILSFAPLFLMASTISPPIHVEVRGSGAPLILIPGFTVPGSVWYPLVNELEKTHECHIVTLAGFGGKEPIEFPWLPKVNQSLKEYIIKNKLQNPAVIGHSLGGTIATWLASQDDLSLSQIIVVDALPASGALMIPNFDPDNLAYESPFNNQQLAMDDADFENLATTMSQGMSVNRTTQEKIKKWIVQTDRKTYVYGYTDYLKMDIREDLKKISIPVTIIAATKPYGKTMVAETYNNQYENLTDYDLIFANEAAHFVMLDMPDWFLDQVISILSIHKK